MQEQLDKIQKVVVGMGRAMHVFDGDDNNEVPNMAPNVVQNETKTQQAEISQAPTISLMQDFVKTSNDAKPNIELMSDAPKVKPDYDKLRRSRIKTISFSNTGTEYDLQSSE